VHDSQSSMKITVESRWVEELGQGSPKRGRGHMWPAKAFCAVRDVFLGIFK